jgi:DNA adenine methylase
MKPLYIWAGGKNKMIPKYQAQPGIPLSGYDTYVEPFFGGGAMMIHVYENNPTVKRFVMNDINPEIVGIYRAIKSDLANFLTRIDAWRHSSCPWPRQTGKRFTTTYEQSTPQPGRNGLPQRNLPHFTS